MHVNIVKLYYYKVWLLYKALHSIRNPGNFPTHGFNSLKPSGYCLHHLVVYKKTSYIAAKCTHVSQRIRTIGSASTNVLSHTVSKKHSFFPLACAECDDSLPFSGASSIPLCYVLFPATLFHQLFFHPLSLHLAIYFLVCLSILLFQNSYIVTFWEFYFLPFSVHAQTNIIYLNLLSLL